MSSDGERSPKRQRRSYSPASPAPETKPFVSAPQTPPPSVHMSPSWTAQQPSGPSSVTFPTPPSTAGFQGQQRGVSFGGESGQPTPEEGEGRTDVEMVDRQEAEDVEHGRTDHDRQDGGSSGDADMMPPPPAPPLYRLSAKPIAPSRPHPSQDLISLYNLQATQRSVARKDEHGNKINKLRKSYEGKVKELGLDGKARAVQGNSIKGFGDPQWDLRFEEQGGATGWELELKGKGIEYADGEAVMSGKEILSKMDSALRFAPGKLPHQEHEHWKHILGFDEAPNKATPNTNASRPMAANPMLAKTMAVRQTYRASAPASPARHLGAGAVRPERTGKKRRYDESSYSGYQEGFEDDGCSTGGVDDTGSRRGSGVKRQKTAPNGPVQAGRVGVHA